MALVEWNDKLVLGIPSIDEQHQRLVSILNSLYDAMLSRHGQDVLATILKELVEYTVEHFSYEERLFAMYGYRHSVEHTERHFELSYQVREFREKVEAGRLGMSPAVLEFLTHWLTDHICTDDEKYVRFLMAKGVR